MHKVLWMFSTVILKIKHDLCLRQMLCVPETNAYVYCLCKARAQRIVNNERDAVREVGGVPTDRSASVSDLEKNFFAREVYRQVEATWGQYYPMEQPETNQPETKVLSTFRAICFTDFKAQPYENLPKGVTYIAWTCETCPSTGRSHNQGWAYSEKPQRLTGWKKALPGAHIESMRGTFAQNDAYCSKTTSGVLKELGVRPMENGKKRVLLQIKECIEAGESVSKLQKRDEYFEPILRYERGLRDYERRCRADKSIEAGYSRRNVTVLIGAAGSGKTRYVYEQHNGHSIYTMPKNDGRWFGTYDGQPVVLFDDVSPGDIMPITTFLRITDGYPIEVEIKNGFTPWVPTHIYITSNLCIRDWWPTMTDEQYLAVQRRLTEVIFK